MESTQTTGPGGAEARFAQLYADHVRDVTAYVLRRTAGRDDAADLVAEVFLAAWRRVDEVPPKPEALPWLYWVARGLLANSQRSQRRRARLHERLRFERTAEVTSEAMPELETVISTALGRLRPKDREVLMLAGWEGLEPADIARVLRITQVAARSRLHRAKRRLERELAALETGETRRLTPGLDCEEPG